MAREHELRFRLNATTNSGFQAAFRSAQASMSQFREQYNALANAAKDISGYERQQQAVENTTAKLGLLQTQYDNIQKEINETGSFSSDLENKLAAKGAQIEKTTGALFDQNEALRQYEFALKGAGVNTGDLTGESARLKSEMDSLRRGFDDAQQGAEQFGEKGVQSIGELQQMLAGAGIVALMKQVADYFRDAADASVEFEAGMAAVRRTVGGSREDIAALGDEFQRMAARLPITTGELAEIATTAGQLGIAQDRVQEFTLIMAQLATTTDLTADNAATMLAQFSNITGTTDYARLGATVAALGDATATTASKVVDMSQGMAAAASVAGMSERDVLALAASVGSLGIEAQAGSSSMSQLINRLYTAVETGDDLAAYAQIANMSAQEFKTAWGRDALGALDAFVQGLNDTERNGKSAIVVLNELGITNVRQTKAILSLAQAGDLLKNSIDLANRSWDENAALQEKAGIMYDTTQARLTMMQNSFGNLKIAVGDQFNPTLGRLYELAGKAADGMARFTKEHPAAARALSSVAIGLTTVTAGLAAYTAAAAAAKVVTSALAGPIGWVDLGLTALGVSLGVFIATMGRSDSAFSDMTASIREMDQAMADANAQMAASEQDIAVAAMTAGAYIDRLEALEQAGTATGASQREYAAILAEVQRLLPGVNIELDEQTGLVENGAASLRDLADGWKQAARAQVYYEAYTEKAKAYFAVQKDVNEAQEKLNSLQEQLPASLGEIEAKQRALNFAQAKYNALTLEGIGDFDVYDQMMRQYDDQIIELQEDIEGLYGAMTKEERAAMAEQDDLNAAISAGREAMNQYSAEMNTLESQLSGFEDANRDGADSMDGMNGSIKEVMDHLSDLSEAYGEAYRDALESIQGQFSLWEEAPTIVDGSVQELTKALESQTTYWTQYSYNLDALNSRNIEGLDSYIRHIADGSTKSAGYIAALSKAGDEDLQAIVESWQALNEAQESSADSLALTKTNFDGMLDEMTGKIEDAVDEMNLSYEARQAAMQTVSSYIDAADGMVGSVRSAYVRVANAARDALQYGSMTVITRTGGENIGRVGYAEGTDYASPGWRWVGENGPELMRFQGGEQVVPHTKSVELLERSAEPAPVNVTYAPVYNITGGGDPQDIRAILEEHDRALPGMITTILRDQQRDATRRAYM